MPLERILQSQGFGSRKACRELIEAGRVAVNGQPCRQPGMALVADESLILQVDDTPWPWRAAVYLALYKPAGVECSHQPQHHRSVFSLLPAHFVARGVQCAGRLDADTTGLLLMSDDGAWLHALASPKRHVPKTYRVSCRHPLDEAMLQALRNGVMLHDESQPLAALHCEQAGERQLILTIDQGKYHQVKRMVAAAGNRVEGLHREAVGALQLGTGELAELAEGSWHMLSDMALAALRG
ncbi:pseudouridine synthase [Chitinimonas sp.]|uniref:pseudouridine synthase n=1 Tax=Chitinimonas sp. TaxID=1934313 RepID=UPI0035ADEF7E